MPRPGKNSVRAPLAGLSAPRGHLHVDAFDQFAERGIEPVARLRQGHLDLGEDAAGIAAEDQDPIAHQHRFLDVVGHQDHALDGHATFGPQVQEIGAQGLGGEHVERRERLIHQQDVRMHHQRPGEAHALAHAAGQFARIGRFEAVQADQIDGRQRARADFGPRQTLRLQSQRDVLEHGEPGKERKALEHHRDARGRTVDRLAQVVQ